MSSILQQPDSLSLSGNLKKFLISSDAEVSFLLQRGEGVTILDEKYQPDADGLITIDVKAVIERLLEVVIPSSGTVTEQTAGTGDFTATIDGTALNFRVIKGGVAELEPSAESWLAEHFLTWQPQEKLTLQSQPEWLGIYPTTSGHIVVVLYFADGTSTDYTLATLFAGSLYTIDVSWAAVNDSSQAIAWDVWFENEGGRLTPIQRYQLRSPGEEEYIYVWANTLGGIDSVSFTGAMEEDEKLEHKDAIYYDDSISEYDIDKAREIRQSTGYISEEVGMWLKDFFYSKNKQVIRPDGSFRQIAVVGSKIVSSSADDEYAYEFTYRMGVDEQLLNLERTHTTLPAPEGLDDFFFTDLLSALTEASYQDSLILAVQSPYAIGWQKMSIAQLWAAALPTLVDNVTIVYRNGKLVCIITPGTGGDGTDTGGGTITPPADSRTELIDGAIYWRSGLTYESTIIHYKILGNYYSANAKTLTLADADATYDRIDLFYVDQYSQLQVMTGTPAPNPTSPILISKQLEVMSVMVQAGASEPADVNIEKVYDEHAEWGTSHTVTDPLVDTGVTVDFESDDLPLNGDLRIKVGIDISDTVIAHPLHRIGDTYQGGIIFWLSADGTTGLIVAPSDTAVDVFWSRLSGFDVYATDATSTAIGTGKANTDLMLANDAAANQAVKYCNNLIIDIYDDWYMPSELELAEIYFRRMVIGGISTKTYWSSTESAWNKSRCISFADGVLYTRDKNNAYSVRAIRSFDDADVMAGVPITEYAPNNVELAFTAPSPVVVKDGILTMNIKSSLPWLKNSIVLIETWLGENRTGTCAIGIATNLFGYKTGEDGWQRIAIQMYNFAPDNTKLDCFKIRLEGSWPNGLDLGLDDIRFQHSEIEGAVALLLAVDRTDFAFQEEPDGVRMMFTTLVPYIGTSTKIYLNGVRQVKGVGKDYIEDHDQIVFSITPEENSGFEIDYKTYAHD